MPEFNITISIALTPNEIDTLISCLEACSEEDPMDLQEETLMKKLREARYGTRIKP